MNRIAAFFTLFSSIKSRLSARPKSHPWPLFTFLILAALLAGCSVAVENESVPASISSEKLTIYSGRSSSLVDPVIQQFGQATGIEIAVKYANTAQLAATLLEEGDRTPADIFFAQDPGGLAAVEHMLARLDTAVLEKVPDWARSSEGKWVGLSGRARTVVFNTETLTEADLPADMFAFTDPKWKGRIGWAPTNASFQTMVSAMNSMWGEEKTLRWLKGIQANDPKAVSYTHLPLPTKRIV